MGVSVGVDIIEVDRVKNAILNDNNFRKRIFTEKEIEYCEKKGVSKYQSYAARFAAKEAVYKALSDKMPMDYRWVDCEVLNDTKGKPYVNLALEIKGVNEISLSLTHLDSYAVAFVEANID